MKVDGWFCTECRWNFNEPRPGHDVRTYDGSIVEEQPRTCPYCGSPDIQYGYYECEDCGNYHTKEEMASDEYCKSCADRAWKALDEYLTNGVQMEDKDKVIIKVLLEEM